MDFKINTQIITNEISIKNHNLEPKQYTLVPIYARNIGHIADERYFTELSVEIKNTEDTPFPISIYVKMTAIFTIEKADKLEEKDIERFLKINGTQTLVPHLRAIISSSTASALLPPVILPLVNVLQLFPEDKNLLSSIQTQE